MARNRCPLSQYWRGRVAMNLQLWNGFKESRSFLGRDGVLQQRNYRVIWVSSTIFYYFDIFRARGKRNTSMKLRRGELAGYLYTRRRGQVSWKTLIALTQRLRSRDLGPEVIYSRWYKSYNHVERWARSKPTRSRRESSDRSVCIRAMLLRSLISVFTSFHWRQRSRSL